MSVMFGGMTYLGSASVDAPISEIEANRKMHILKEQATGTEPIPVVLSIPMTNHGSVTLKDPKTEMPMANYPIKTILFCARGNAEVLLDCFCLNVKNKQSGMYQCHVFRCEDMDEVSEKGCFFFLSPLPTPPSSSLLPLPPSSFLAPPSPRAITLQEMVNRRTVYIGTEPKRSMCVLFLHVLLHLIPLPPDWIRILECLLLLLLLLWI